MNIRIPLSCLLSTLLGAPLLAQTPSPAPPAKPPTQTAPAPAPVRRRPATSAAPVTVTITVYDKAGSPIGDTAVSLLSDQPREAKTTAGGIARFLSVKPGEYRLRFDHEGFVSLERTLTVKGGSAMELEITLTPMPAAPAPKAPDPVPASNAPAGDAKALSVVDFLEGNHLSGRDPIKSDQLGCTASARTTLLQIRDDLQEKSTADADEVLYVVAGQGSLRLGNKDVALEAGGLAIVPRGTVRGLSRKGKNPLIVLSVVSGPACTK
jgi:mannose-6-phosphate isomerase-like protein (cupin superfamily)